MKLFQSRLGVNEISQLLGDLHLSPKNTDEQEEIRLLLLECDEDLIAHGDVNVNADIDGDVDIDVVFQFFAEI